MSKLVDQWGNPVSDSYTTPSYLTDVLPLVDTDPCSNPRSTVRSRRTYSLETNRDGLKLAWLGSVFVNWPYSCPLLWVNKLIYEVDCGHCTEAIVLCKLDCSTEWWNTLVGWKDPEMWLLNDRVPFGEPEELKLARVEKMEALRAARLIAQGKVDKRKPGAKKAGEKSSNNFCSVILHYRTGTGAARSPILPIAHIATRWGRLN